MVYQGDIGNGGVAAGYQWLEKSYDFTVQANAKGTVYAAIGIQGTSEG